ncbi:MAG: hypothetical protein WCL23_02985 [Candidatus Moraniibacteriota bacterium]
MKRFFMGIVGMLFLMITLNGCAKQSEQPQTADETQRIQQEKILQESVAQVSMPAIKNFREKKILKDIIELCDQDGLVTYTYLENMNPVIVHGSTALGGKLTYLGQTIGYGIPYATQFTSPQRIANYDELNYTGDNPVVPQADPNGLFKPASAEGTWILMLDPVKKKVSPQYIEPRIVTMTYKLPVD